MYIASMSKFSLALVIISFLYGRVRGQHLPVAVNFQKSYQQQSRSIDGSPGKNYWQNGAKYAIRVNFNPDTRALAGSEGIDYYNNSPDTLKKVVFKLYPNLYQAQAMRNVPIAADDLTKGVSIQNMQLDSVSIAEKKRVIRGTNMYVTGLRILPGQHVHFDVDFNYTLNKTSFIRTGQVDTGAFMIAYFFPRIAVYDDIDGWNEYPYMGKEEFYNDYCDFSVDLTVPGNYVVWATGELQNATKVYQPGIIQRIQQALAADSVIDIISSANWDNDEVLVPGASHHWLFEAKNVTDFAFALSRHYIWKAAGVQVEENRRVQANAVYNPLHHSFEPVVNYIRKTIDVISHHTPGVPFPYPHETVFEGLDAMEYPMMVNNLPFEGLEAVQFTIHEVYHTLFPFYVGSNETKYSFMDEGWATYSEFMLLKEMGTDFRDEYDLRSINESAGTDIDMPIMTPTAQLYGAARFSNKDLKPALGFRYLHELLGDALLNKALRYYVSQWNGKHPTPYDFFACMNKGAGINLDWFWQNWYFEKNVPDLGIDQVTGNSVVIARVGAGMVPVHVEVTYTDGSKERISRPVDCWKDGKRKLTLPFTAKKKVACIQLGDDYDADVDRANNTRCLQ
ncbi:peptidase [Chitinophaga silvisoli]|uniref:Peptidase n=2 Tax=Chitinophaga silvisoli TaxID=2291814 RepID=A0A3E1P1K2_9BACT|nr:peptidase [Chitinophaga silvisoli]